MLLLLAGLLACGPDVSVAKVAVDADHDGYDASVDCDDAHATVNPDAAESCDGLDNDCDGTVDEDATDAETRYGDSDADGYGDADAPVTSCDPPAGSVATADDCDDGDADVHPGAAEWCNAVDDDCDGATDEDAADAQVGYPDTDGDGYGDAASVTRACELPSGHVADATDCDDGDAAVNPGEAEVCDGAVDEDCDTLVDDADPDVSDPATWYADTDRDGYGDAASVTRACDLPSGHVADASDCDDGDAAVNPGEAEVCDGAVDEDCDGVVDEECAHYDGDVTIEAERAADNDADGMLYGEVASDVYGATLAGGYDLDGDGREELVVNAHGASYATGTGSAYVYDTLPTGVEAALTSTTARLYGGDSSGNVFPVGASGVADLDEDGRDELSFTLGQTSANYAVFLLLGPDVAGTFEVTDSGHVEASLALTGPMVAGGDLAGTGVATVVVGDWDANSNQGAVHVYTHAPATLTLLATLDGEAPSDFVGYLSAAGSEVDVDGDGVDDLLLGASGDDTSGSDAGAVYVVLGPVSGTRDLATADLKILGSAASDRFGARVTAVGDVSGDGRIDLLTSASGSDAGGSNAGALHLLAGLDPAAVDADATAADAWSTILGDAASDALGNSLWATGDTNGDGEVDLLAGATAWDNGGYASAGAAWLVYGPLVGTYDLGADYDARFRGDDGADYCGSGVALTDLDADGRDEIAVSCSLGEIDAAYSQQGAVYLFAGG